MSCCRRIILLNSLCVLALARPVFSQSTTAQVNTANVVSIEASSKELAQGYLAWLHKHPEFRPGSGSKLAQSGKAGDSYKILWPTLDIYSTAGISIYHSNDSEKNVRIIHALPQISPKFGVTPGNHSRPTLDEAKAMFPEFSHIAIPFSAHIRYTLFVINYAQRPACKAQDAAMQQLKKRVNGSQIRIIEVRIK